MTHGIRTIGSLRSLLLAFLLAPYSLASAELSITKPGVYPLGNEFSLTVKSGKDPDGLVRNELTISASRLGRILCTDSTALAFGEGTWGIRASRVEKGLGLKVTILDRWGIFTHDFQADKALARMGKPGFDREAHWFMTAKRFQQGEPASFFDPEAVAWGKKLMPLLKPEPEAAHLPKLEVRLLPAEGEKVELVRPTVARLTVGYRRLGTFIPLGERLLGEEQLELKGMMTAGVLQYLYGVRAGQEDHFTALCRKHQGRKAALVKNGQVVDRFTMSPKLRGRSFARSRL